MLKKIKMAALAMVTKVQKLLNSLQTSQSFAVMFPVTSKLASEKRKKNNNNNN
jgi:hypothetical protein